MEDKEKAISEIRPDYESKYNKLLKEVNYIDNANKALSRSNELLKAQLEMVYLIFGNRRVSK